MRPEAANVNPPRAHWVAPSRAFKKCLKKCLKRDRSAQLHSAIGSTNATLVSSAGQIDDGGSISGKSALEQIQVAISTTYATDGVHHPIQGTEFLVEI